MSDQGEQNDAISTDLEAEIVRSDRARRVEKSLAQAKRRQKQIDANVCICGPVPGALPRRPTTIAHGPVVKHHKCQRCLDVYGKSKSDE